MLDTLSHENPKFYLARTREEDAMCLLDEEQAQIKAHREVVWNALIPRNAVEVELKPWGVRYRHPTKGWKTVGKRRFAVRGVV